MSAPGLAARQAATSLLTGVLVDRKTLSEQIDDPSGPIAGLEGSERARAQSIATGVLRNLSALDDVLATFLKKPPPLKITQILRVAAWEMLVDGVPAHAAVDAAVNAAKASRKVAFLSGLTNAVSRKISKIDNWSPQPQAMPAYLRKPMVKAWGEDATQRIEIAHSKAPPTDLTLKPELDPKEWAQKLDAELLPTQSLRLKKQGQISMLPGFNEGAFWVQDAAAAIPVRLLGDLKGKTVLDCCAAPGGKTMQAAAQGAKVTAIDNSDTRMKRVKANLKRTGLEAKLIVKDAVKWSVEGRFDVIILDAPCSATGTMRRHPDLPHIRKDMDLSHVLRLQTRLITNAITWLKPGGTLLFCTCSLLPSEGEEQVQHALTKGLTLVRPEVPWIEDRWLTDEGMVRLRPDYWPERGGMDGFFAAIMRKK